MTTILETSEKIMDRQQQINAKITRDYESARLHNIDMSAIARDVGEAVQGIPNDLFGNRASMSAEEIFTKNNRLRGVGVLMMVIAAVFLLF